MTRRTACRRDVSFNLNSTSLTLFSLLAWWSAQATLTQLQYRVRQARRPVPYQHVLEGRGRDSDYSRFWIPEGQKAVSNNISCSSIRKGPPNPPSNHMNIAGRLLTVRSGEKKEELMWMYMADASTQTVEIPKKHEAKSRRLVEEQPFLSSFGTGLRRLYDQFVGQDSRPGLDEVALADKTVDFGNKTYNWNISTEVLFDMNTSVIYTTMGEPKKTPRFRPLRIHAILAESSGYGGSLSDEERDSLFHDILSPALLTWSSSLRVDPVVGNLTVDVHQLYDGQTCGPGVNSGLPSVKVPLEHLSHGIPDTDMIVYLSLGFVERDETVRVEGIRPNSTNSSLGSNASEEETTGQSSHFENRVDSTFPSTSLPNVTDAINPGNGSASNLTKPKSSNGCGGQYLAAASFCSTDQYDRPTAALLHICIDELFFEPTKLNRNILMVMHELGHALGFNSLSMAHFRRPDGTPITSRVNGEIPDSQVECTGPSSERRSARVPLPSDEILQFRSVRGGVRVAELVTPSVLQVVRNQFDCQRLLGAELESGESLPLSSSEEEGACIGDHWERRLFSSDLMNPIIDEIGFTGRVSTLTLAYFADSGWYQVDLSRADVAAGWGRGAGCGFVNDTCIGKDGQVPPQNAPFFCNDVPTAEAVAGEIHGCTPDLSRKAVCSIGHYDLDLPSEYQYFIETYGSDVGGADPFMDYCPVYSGFSNGLCSSSENLALKASPIERFGERNSRCLLSNIETHETALCLPIACVVEDRSLRIKVDGVWKLCEHYEQRLKVAGDVRHVVLCPDPRRVCPTFYCPYDCLGTGGACDYLSGKCLCEVQIGYGTKMQVCGENGTDALDIILNGPFLRPSYQEKEDNHPPEMPHPDSPLSDYYVPTTESLHDDRSSRLNPWAVALACLGCVLGAVVAAVSLHLYGGMCHPLGQWWNRAAKKEGSGASAINRDKDKMIATVLVDMRIHTHDALNIPPNDVPSESVAETDCQLTMSEVSSGEAPSESQSELSSRPPSESLSDADTHHDDSFNEDLLPTYKQTIIRRRVVNESQQDQKPKRRFSIG